MLNYPILKRHFQSVHSDTALKATFHCSICNTDLSNAASVPCKRAHGGQNRTFHKALPRLCLTLISMQPPNQMPQVRLLPALGIVVQLDVHVRSNGRPMNNPLCRPLFFDPLRQIKKQP